MAINTTEISAGVTGRYIPAQQFKTSRITVQLLTPLNLKTVSRNAMLPFILTRACKSYPDLKSLNSKLASLYGAALMADVSKLGNMHSLTFTISSINDKYTLDNAAVSGECGKLLINMLFNPLLDGARFNQKLFDSEKRLFLERIDGEINEKRRYAISRAENIMCETEPFGISKYGPRAMAQGLDSGELYLAWKDLLKTAIININFIGQGDPTPIYDAFKKAISSIERQPVCAVNQSISPDINGKSVTERMAVTQSKLVMGFKSDINCQSKNYIPAVVFCDLYGGSPHSKLFQNVREKLSLCYYCAARYNRSNGIMMVDSGIQEEKAEQARAEIIKQLEEIKNGNISNDELSASKAALTDSARSVNDSQYALDSWYSQRSLDSDTVSPRQFAEMIKNVTKEQIIEASKHFSLDTTYLLAPNGGKSDE